MAAIRSYAKPSLFSVSSSRRRTQCCTASSNNNKNTTPMDQSPLFLRISVSAVTELLRLFSPATKTKLNEVDEEHNEISVSSVDDIMLIIKSDYEKAYFVTGDFTSEVYAEDCIFEDPTISFRGTELYSNNLKLLVPFFEEPSIKLKYIDKGDLRTMHGKYSGNEFITASWTLRTYLKLPWRPLISIDGSTVYNLDEKLKIVKHVESWNISALEAVGQIFTSGSRSSDS